MILLLLLHELHCLCYGRLDVVLAEGVPQGCLHNLAQHVMVHVIHTQSGHVRTVELASELP